MKHIDYLVGTSKQDAKSFSGVLMYYSVGLDIIFLKKSTKHYLNH
jgi:hypothetical protein